MWNIELRRGGENPLARQLFFQLRNLILEGRVAAGEALPSSRVLARDLSVSRNTVCEAYDMLITEGFVESRQGAATRVREGLRLEKPTLPAAPQQPPAAQGLVADFKTGRPDLSRFPGYLWNRTVCRACEELEAGDLGYCAAEGCLPLREEIAQWLFRQRGIAAAPESIFVTMGATQAISLLVRLLHSPGRPLAVEDPCHIGMLETIKNWQLPFEAVEADENGLRVELLQGRALCAVYVTPSHQFPLGGILPAERRAALLRMARAQGFYIIEDDYDSEFRYSGAPVTPLYSMDNERVVYVGTFSKTLYPALRIGFAVVPPPLQAEWVRLRRYMDVQNPIVEQAALARFLRERKLDKHVQQMRRLYGQRREALIASVSGCFGNAARIRGDAAGLHLVLELMGAHFGGDFIAKSRAYGIRAMPVEAYCIKKGRHTDKLLLGYGHMDEEKITEGVAHLYRFLKEEFL